jgi:hypothetical protein
LRNECNGGDGKTIAAVLVRLEKESEYWCEFRMVFEHVNDGGGVDEKQVTRRARSGRVESQIRQILAV